MYSDRAATGIFCPDCGVYWTGHHNCPETGRAKTFTDTPRTPAPPPSVEQMIEAMGGVGYEVNVWEDKPGDWHAARTAWSGIDEGNADGKGDTPGEAVAALYRAWRMEKMGFDVFTTLTLEPDDYLRITFLAPESESHTPRKASLSWWQRIRAAWRERRNDG